MNPGRSETTVDPEGALADEVVACLEDMMTVDNGKTEPDRNGRDFGDSAGYGSGGSTRDYQDVVGEGMDPPPRHNPLDSVMRNDMRRSGDLTMLGAVLVGLAVLAVPFGLYVWQRTQPQREQTRRARMGQSRESLARMQM